MQGEGPMLGHSAAFVRLMGCNLSCAWCDTPWTWDGDRFDLAAETTLMTPTEIVMRVEAMRPRPERVVLTGGEPLVQQQRLGQLARYLAAEGYAVDVETNGTIAPNEAMRRHVSLFVVSPKVMPSAAQTARATRLAPVAPFRELAAVGRAVFKYVARDLDDVDAVAEHATRYSLAPVYVMPEGTGAVPIVNSTRRIADAVIAHGFRLSTRLHVLAWGNERGR